MSRSGNVAAPSLLSPLSRSLTVSSPVTNQTRRAYRASISWAPPTDLALNAGCVLVSAHVPQSPFKPVHTQCSRPAPGGDRLVPASWQREAPQLRGQAEGLPRAFPRQLRSRAGPARKHQNYSCLSRRSQRISFPSLGCKGGSFAAALQGASRSAFDSRLSTLDCLPPPRLQQLLRVEFGDIEAAHGFADLGGAFRHHLGLVVMRGGADNRFGALIGVRGLENA